MKEGGLWPSFFHVTARVIRGALWWILSAMWICNYKASASSEHASFSPIYHMKYQTEDDRDNFQSILMQHCSIKTSRGGSVLRSRTWSPARSKYSHSPRQLGYAKSITNGRAGTERGIAVIHTILACSSLTRCHHPISHMCSFDLSCSEVSRRRSH